MVQYNGELHLFRPFVQINVKKKYTFWQFNFLAHNITQRIVTIYWWTFSYADTAVGRVSRWARKEYLRRNAQHSKEISPNVFFVPSDVQSKFFKNWTQQSRFITLVPIFPSKTRCTCAYRMGNQCPNISVWLTINFLIQIDLLCDRLTAHVTRLQRCSAMLARAMSTKKGDVTTTFHADAAHIRFLEICDSSLQIT